MAAGSDLDALIARIIGIDMAPKDVSVRVEAVRATAAPIDITGQWLDALESVYGQIGQAIASSRPQQPSRRPTLDLRRVRDLMPNT